MKKTLVIAVTISVIATMLITSVFTPIQLIIDGVSNFEIQKELAEADILDSGPIVLPAEHEPVRLSFI